jgi:hypothetical protein
MNCAARRIPGEPVARPSISGAARVLTISKSSAADAPARDAAGTAGVPTATSRAAGAAQAVTTQRRSVGQILLGDFSPPIPMCESCSCLCDQGVVTASL